MAKERYELVQGIHVTPKAEFLDADPATRRAGHGDTHDTLVKGAVIESEEDLERKWVNKWRKVTSPAPVVVSEERKQAVSDMLVAGPWQEDDREFLEQLPDDGFQKVSLRTARPEAPQQKKKATSALGEDVTDQFESAQEMGLKVFKNQAGKHQVARPDAVDKPLSGKPLGANEVDKFLENYSKEK